MTDQATEHALIEAPRHQVIDALTDFEHYPNWAPDVKDVRILDRDSEGRGRTVEYRVAALGRSTRVQLRYDYSALPDRLTWQLVSGDVVRRFDGHYVLLERDNLTDVLYTVTVDLAVPLPKFVKDRAEAKIRRMALPELKAVLEAA